MATRAELEQQLATIQAGLLDFTAIGEEAYFRQTGQTKLSKQELPRFTDVYNPIYQATKNIQFSLGEDTRTTAAGDLAFYTYNAERLAEQKTQQQIAAVEQANLAAATQEEAIKSFLASEKQVAQESVFQKYLSQILNPQVPKGGINPLEWDTIDPNTPSGWAKWKATKRSEKTQVRGVTTDGRATPQYTYYIKLTPEQVAEKRKTTEAIERIRFMSSPTLQKTYADIYSSELQKTITTMVKQEEKTAKIKSEIEKYTTALSQPGAKTGRLNKKIKQLTKKLPPV